jgi:hypothetical protein
VPPEDELNDPGGMAAKHPEAASDPEAVLPATETLKEQILERVKAEAQAGKGREEDGSWEASKIAADGQTRLKVYLFAAPAEDGHIATVVATTDYNEKDGTGIDTGYRILQVPDGVHIERGVRDHIDLREPRPNPLRTGDEIIASAQETLAEGKRWQEARETEQELGLHFFSLRNAKELLTLLEGSKPQS